MKKIALTLGLLAMGANIATAQTIRMGSEGAYPPYNFINDNNELDGFERDVGDELCRRANVQCEWVINDWDTIIPNLVSGNYDTIMAGMSITPAREEVISFTRPYLPPEYSSYVALAGTDASVINDGVIAAQSSTIQASHVADTDADLIEFPTPDESLAAVRNGEADALLADKGFLQRFVDESGGELVFIGEDIAIDNGIGMGTRQSDNERREMFNDAINSMVEDGTLNEKITEWFGEDAQTF
ncbi:MAG: transporter substrate-binding domain-containing protein [Natronospirillum sp.]